MAEGGRMTLKNRLRERGCEVTVVQLYRTVFRKDLYQELSKQDFEKIDCVIFTSPSSVDAFLDFFSLHANIRIGAIGSYTDHHLRQLGFNDSKILPQGDFSRIEEILRDEQ
jgi:uroporphyrinogen-III synthase